MTDSAKIDLWPWTEASDYLSSDTANLQAGALLESSKNAATLGGDDRIIGTSLLIGVLINGTLSMGGGRDELIGYCDLPTTNGASGYSIFINDAAATIKMGAGSDLVKAASEGHGFFSKGTIYMGDGNDYFLSEGYTSGSGSIYFGKGSDTVEARFGRSGAIAGEDLDRLKFYGGAGQDRIKLRTGGYTLSKSGETYTLTSFHDAGDYGWNFKNNTAIELVSFESIDSGSFQTSLDSVRLNTNFFIRESGAIEYDS